MGSDDEFGPDTETIRAWLNKRASYAKDARVIGGAHRASPAAVRAARPSPAAPSAPPKLPANAVDGTDVGRSVLAALGVDAQSDAGRADGQTDGQVDSTTAGRSVVDALRDAPTGDVPGGTGEKSAKRPKAVKVAKPSRHRRPESAPEPVPPAAAPEGQERARRPQARTSTPPPARYTAPTNPTTPATPTAPSRRGASRAAPPSTTPTTPTTMGSGSRWTEPEEHRYSEQAGTDADFPARGRARLVLSLILLATLVGTAVAGYAAYQDRTVAAIGVAATLAFLSLVVWAVRTGCTTTKLTLRRGQLSIERGGRTEVVDIGNPYHPIAIVGEPGHRRWTVLIERVGQPLIVINAAMVDPYWFTGLLYRIRPELRPDAHPHLTDRG